MWRLSAPRAALRLLLEEELQVGAIFFAMNEDDVAAVLSADFVSIGSDASARALVGPTAQGVPHPRTFGCFPRVFGRYVRGRRTRGREAPQRGNVVEAHAGKARIPFARNRRNLNVVPLVFAFELKAKRKRGRRFGIA